MRSSMSLSCAKSLCAVAIFVSLAGHAQTQRKILSYKRQFQFSLFPGISTNGTSSGVYLNNFSFNLFGGASAGSRILEIGVISNSNFQRVTGIQFAGLANIVGANAFLNLTLSESNSAVLGGFESSVQGIQVAGLLNYVRNKSTGIQLSGGLNTTGGDFSGFQFAGIGNTTGASAQFLQLAGGFNIAAKSVTGFQISGLFNYAGLQLSGMQLGLVNRAGWIRGKRSVQETPSRGCQVGLVNFCREMDGLQIGLINFGGPAGGTQVGLINFFSKYGSKQKHEMGTPIGLLNFGSRGSYIRVSINEVFTTNLEYTTGNCQNCTWTQTGMPYEGRNRIFNQNALIVGYDARKETWGFGYGFQKVLYDKKTMAPSTKIQNERRLLRYGVKFIHLNKQGELSRAFNLLSRATIDYGRKFKGLYFFGGTSVNHLAASARTNVDQFSIASPEVQTIAETGFSNTFWLGFEAGVQLTIATANVWE